MAYWRLYYHLVWATKERQHTITAQRELELYPYLLGKARALGCDVRAIGGVEDHIHLVLSIPPTLSIAEVVKKLKGSSAYHLNRAFVGGDKFGWQDGYGAFSLGSKQLDKAIAYVQNQKQHHSNGTYSTAFEKCNERDDPLGVN